MDGYRGQSINFLFFLITFYSNVFVNGREIISLAPMYPPFINLPYPNPNPKLKNKTKYSYKHIQKAEFRIEVKTLL